MAFQEDLSMVGGIDESYNNPDIFQEAWNHPNSEEMGIGEQQSERSSITRLKCGER